MNRRRIATLIGLVLILAALLAFDLLNRGLTWQAFWSLTGEESPPAQILGMVEWAGNFTRVQPRTDPLTPIDHTYENPYGVNVFLQEEVEPAKRERIVQMVSEAGFTWIRQQFPWEDIEIAGRGDFEDRRNDLDGDGQPDTISAWAKYDQIVDLAGQYGLSIFARLDNPPAWSRSNADLGDFAPPDDVQDFVNYATAVAQRYRGRIRYYQVWNEPNIYPEWGNQDVSPEGYTDLLCRTYAALKAVDPAIVVASGALAPTVSLSGRDLNDYIFLQRMYDAGAADCFDVLAIQGYGFNSGPTDQRMRPTTINFAHNVYLRDLMVANGDAHKPIWITEAAWNPQPRDPSVVTSLYGNYGIVTPEQAARYMPLAYQRAQEDWPWVGVMFYWFFKRPSDAEQNQSWYYFRMVEPDFTPLPVYDSMKQYITTQQPVLYPGVHQAEDWAIRLPDDAQVVDTEGAQFGQAVRTSTIGFTLNSHDDLWVRWRSESDLPEAQMLDTQIDAEGWYVTHLTAREFFPTGHTVPTQLGNESTPPFLVDSLTVADRSYERLFGPIAALVIGVGMLLWVIARALRERRQGS